MSLLIHVGYPKAASTWLQANVFGNPGYGFCEPSDNTRGLAIAEFVVTNPFHFDPAQARKSFEPGLAEVWRQGRVAVISDETLCGNPFQRRYDGRYVADRLYATFPEARILICVREQRSMALSMYRQHVAQGGLHDLREFIGTGSELPGMTPILWPDFMEFDVFAGYYSKLFGQDRVMVMPLEELEASTKMAVGRIQQFCELERTPLVEHPRSNVGASAIALLFRRPLNAFAQRSPLTQRRGLAYRAVARGTRLVDVLAPRALSRLVEARWRDQIALRYEHAFKKSNSRLAAQFRLPLALYGYDC